MIQQPLANSLVEGKFADAPTVVITQAPRDAFDLASDCLPCVLFEPSV